MIGTTLQGRYHLLSEIGRGGMGVVCRAQDNLLNRAVAIKVLSSSNLGEEGRDKLLAEAQAAAKLNHPNIVSIYDAGISNGDAFIVMELVEGQSVHQQPPKEIDKILSLGRQMCTALDHAHKHDIVHRDLKPENVLITTDGTVKLMDFGLARSITSRITSEGVIEGTVYYLAPEQALGQNVDGRTDLYALGVMLYELITKRLPFISDNPMEVISQHLHAPVVPPLAHNPAIPHTLNDLILKLLNKRPEDRPAAAREVEHVLKRIEEGDIIATPEVVQIVSGELSLLDRIVRGRMVGRERELAEAKTLWNRAASGDGQVLLISGEPGIGKTRFVRELTSHVEVSGNTVVTGACYAEGGAPYSPIAQMIRHSISDPKGIVSDIPEFVLADLITLAPDLRITYPNIPPNPELDAESEQQRIFESFVTFCRTHTDRTPLLLFIDDAHWADGGSLLLLLHLARRTRNLPLLIIASYREVELDEARPLHLTLHDFYRERLATRIKLGRLDRKQTQAMLEAMFTEDISSELLDGVYHETEGNPFFIEEVCKALIEDGKLNFKDGRWHLPVMETLHIPQSIRLAIQSRVGKLSPIAQDTLRLGAILGREFDFEILQAASELDEEKLIRSLEAAERGQLIQEIKHNGRMAFAFVHALIPSTLRESISGLRRQRLHRRAAVAIERLRQDDYEDLAYHYEHAGETSRARSYYVKAGDRANDLFATGDAIAYYNTALEIWPDTDPTGRAELLRKLGSSLQALGELQAALEATEEARTIYEKLGDSIRTGEAEVVIGWLYWASGDRQSSLQHHHRSITILERGEETEEFALAISQISRMHMLASEYEQAITWGERALAMAERLSSDIVKIHSLNNLGVARIHTGEHEKGLKELRESLRLSHEFNDAGQALRAYHNLGEILLALGRYDEARSILNEYQQYSIQIHSHLSEILATLFIAYLDWLTGRWGDSLILRSQVVETFIGIWDVWASLIFGEMDNDLGRNKDAREILENNLSRALSADELQTTVPFLGQLARAHAALRLEIEATQTVKQFLEMIDKNPFFETRSIMSILFSCQWFAEHEDPESLEATQASLERLENAHKQFRHLESEAALAEGRGIYALTKGKAPESVKHLRNASSRWEAMDRPFDQARALVYLSRALILNYEHQEAHDTYSHAYRIFTSLADQLVDSELKQTFLKTTLVAETIAVIKN
jgi:tetratricopeptide (TPR) repeat protein